MQIAKFLVAAVVLTARTCQARIVIKTPRSDETSVVEDLVNIVTSCYKGRINAVGLVGKLPDTLARTLSVHHLIPTVLMADTDDAIHNMLNLKYLTMTPYQFRYKLQLFIVGTSSRVQLGAILQYVIKPSMWFDHMASYIILDQSPYCREARTYLSIAWQLDMLNAKVMCYERNQYQRYMINYNPFTSEAPVSWRPFSVIKTMKNHPCTFYVREYLENDEICVDLDFIKTTDLGGYEITVDGYRGTLQYSDKDFMWTSRAWGGRKWLLDNIYRTLNVTPKFTGNPVKHRDLNADMSMRMSKPVGQSGVAYPYTFSKIVIVSHYKGHKTQLEKIIAVTDVSTRIGMGIVYLITLIFFKFFVHQALVPAILNLVRMTCNTGFTNLNNNTAPRLFLTGLLFFVVTMQGIYQGNLASLLTNKIPYPNINTIDDLMNCNSAIYVPMQHRSLVANAGLEERCILFGGHPDECIMHLMEDLSAVCLMDAEGAIIDNVIQYDLHLSNDFITHIPASFQLKQYWYLEDQVNIILGRMMEADIFESWDQKCNPITLSDFQFDKEVLKNANYKIMELTELLFAFVILGIGLTCATVIFIVEVAIY